MDTTITIPSRFCGPPASANGGYSCGVTALALTDGPATVTLRRPPPLDRPLRVERSREGVALHDDNHLVAEGRGADGAILLPPPVIYDSARRAAEEFDLHHYAEGHAFPGCFTCGPARRDGDGLRVFPAAAGRDRLVVWPWVPDPSVGDEDGLVLGTVMWAVLDCPGGWAWIDGTQPLPPPAVLGRMTAAVHRRPRIGERLVVAGWPITADGRKRLSGSVVWSADGTVLAASTATWVVLEDTQQDAFGAAC
jgi:hypothetical protein